jgi:hypothetical protein
MFEYVDGGTDRVTVIFYWGCVPFGLAWAFHNSLVTGFALEAYLISIGVFVLNPFEMQKQDAKQRWFWQIMLRAGAVVHPLCLIGLWFLDATYPAFVTGTGTIFFMALVVAGGEMVILGETVERFRPENSMKGIDGEQ